MRGAPKIVADIDWGELWLMPRLSAFREAHPNILFCVNGAGDIPLRLGAPDVRITYGDDEDEPLFTDVLLPVSGPELRHRIAGSDSQIQLEGMPLLHLKEQSDGTEHPGWVEWLQKFGHRSSGGDRGVRYQRMRLALEAARHEVGFLVCGLSLMQRDLEEGRLFHTFPRSQHLTAPHPYRMKLRQDAERRPQLQKFVAWLRSEARKTQDFIERTVTGS